MEPAKSEIDALRADLHAAFRCVRIATAQLGLAHRNLTLAMLAYGQGDQEKVLSELKELPERLTDVEKYMNEAVGMFGDSHHGAI